MAIPSPTPQTDQPTPAVLAPSHTVAIEDMRAYLAGLAPTSAAEQLRLLRVAFPDAPLADRVTACTPEA